MNDRPHRRGVRGNVHFIEKLPMMRTSLSFSRQLDAPAGQVWHMITDTRRWPEWGPSIRAVDCSQRFITKGSAGRIQTAAGIWLPFAVEAFKPQFYWDWRVGGISATGHRVDSMGPLVCNLAFTAPIWALPYGLVCHLALLRIKRLLLKDMWPKPWQ